MSSLKITNENIVFQSWEDIEKVLKNSQWKFIKYSTNLDAYWKKITKSDSEFIKEFEIELVFENQWGIRVYVQSEPKKKVRLARIWRKNGLESGEITRLDTNFEMLSDFHFKRESLVFYRCKKEESIIPIIGLIDNWTVKIGRDMWGLMAPRLKCSREKFEQLGFKVGVLLGSP